jgi:lysosomal Pro-X carboxypeptidase
VAGALASSAPVRQFSSITSCEIFNQILTSVYRVAIENSSCVQNIQNLWPVLQNYTSNDTGRKFLNQNFKFCTPMNKSEDFSTFYDYLQDVFGNLAMANYPYETSFLANLPAFPVRQFCGQIDKLFEKHEDLLVAFNNALQVYTNYTGDKKCLDISTAYDPSMGDEGWNFQACTEMVMPMCSNGKDDMFMEKKWNFKEFSDDCYKKFKVYPRERNAITEYVALNVDSTPNVIFSNGLLDPWSGGGVLKSKNDQTIVVILPEGAHHLDLRADNRVSYN